MNQNQTVYFVSLGCSKNLVDSEVMLGHLVKEGVEVVEEPSEARTIVVNTCGFIDSAKKESVDAILEMADYKKPENGVCEALVVAGCLAQRYVEELQQEIPEVDFFIGTGEYPKVVKLLNEFYTEELGHKSFVEVPKYIHTEVDPRINTAPPYMAWLKASEGCDRHCTFCIIPKLRGKLRSRTVDSLVEETKGLVENGVKEIHVISQDLSSYGKDLGEGDHLLNLLKKLETVEGLEWIRLYYLYPDDLTDAVIDQIAASKKICKYIDMPIQHFSNPVLKRMNRKITGEEIRRKVERLRDRVPGVAIRTSLIVGFPGETEEDFQTLLEGIRELRFDHLGVFQYSDEEGTASYKMDGKLSQEVIEERFQIAYSEQEEIASEISENYLGKTVEVIVEGYHEDTELLIAGRHQGQAPEIDGKVLINDLSGRELAVGDIVSVKISEVAGFDLVGGVVE